jgi:hypothetical protein
MSEEWIKAWPFVVEMMKGSWPDEVIAADLRWWETQGQRPGRPTLAKRWGVTDWHVKQQLKRKPPANRRSPPAPTRKKANNPARTATPPPALIEVWTHHRARWPGLRETPPDYARKAITAARKHRREVSDAAFIAEAKLIIDAANDCGDVLFREHIRWEHEPDKPNLAKRIETLCRVNRWEKRVEAALEWDRAGRPRQGKAAPRGKTVRLRDMFRVDPEPDPHSHLEVIDAIS